MANQGDVDYYINLYKENKSVLENISQVQSLIDEYYNYYALSNVKIDDVFKYDQSFITNISNEVQYTKGQIIYEVDINDEKTNMVTKTCITYPDKDKDKMYLHNYSLLGNSFKVSNWCDKIITSNVEYLHKKKIKKRKQN